MIAKLRLVLVLGLVVWMCGGCATIFNGRTQPVTFDTNPSGAMVKVDGTVVGTTPVTVPIERKGVRKHIVMTLEGYETETFYLINSPDNPILFSVLALPGALVDEISGANGKYYDHISIDLEPGWGLNLRKDSDVAVVDDAHAWD